MSPHIAGASDLSIMAAILLLGAITFCYRFSFISSHGRSVAEKIPIRLLNLLAPASFAAIIVNNILHSASDPGLFKQKLLVAVLAFGVAYKTRSVMITLVFGLVVLYFVRSL